MTPPGCADHIAFINGDTTRHNRFGALLCAIGHPVCYVVGKLVRDQNWQALYEKGTEKAAP